MPTNSYDLARTYTSYSGVDIKAVIGAKLLVPFRQSLTQSRESYLCYG